MKMSSPVKMSAGGRCRNFFWIDCRIEFVAYYIGRRIYFEIQAIGLPDGFWKDREKRGRGSCKTVDRRKIWRC